MGRNNQAPDGYQCPYRNACPHLNGQSTTRTNYLLNDAEAETYRNSHYVKCVTEENAALRADNLRLEKEVAELRARLQVEHSSRFKPNRPPPGDLSHPRKRGAPKGHPPWNRRPPEHIDRILHVPAPTTCPHCSTPGLLPTGQQQEQLQEDIILQPKTFVTAYRHDTAFCPICRRPVFQTAEGELRNSQIGPTAKATAVFLRHELNLSLRNTEKIFKHLFGFNFVPASAMAFQQRTARAAEPLHERLRNQVRCADIIHGDETHWRIDGKGAYLWFAGNNNFGCFHIDHSRSGQVALHLFGSNFKGGLVADDYAGYNPIEPKDRQSCLSHLIRKTKEIEAQIASLPPSRQDPKALRFNTQLRELFRDACHLGKLRDTGAISFTKAKSQIPAFYRRLDLICKKQIPHKESETLRQRLIDPKRDYHRLFTFLRINRMPPTNNYAEQSLRHPVILRKIIFGNRSNLGASALAVNLSILHTAHCKNVDPIAMLQTLLLNGHQALISVLFNNSA